MGEPRALTGEPEAPVTGASRLAATSLVVANLLPLWGLATGRMSVGDVFVVYWLENVAVWLLAIVKVATARGTSGGPSSLTVNGRAVDPSRAGGVLAGFFAVHYGIFTLVHGGFALGMAHATDAELHPGSWLLTGLVLLGSHTLSTVLHWFRGDERSRVSPGTAMVQPYPRMLVLHVGIIAGFWLLLAVGGDAGLTHALPAVLLMGLKTGVDLLLHRRQHRRAAAGPGS
ncbi:DUF6498-containing protein [Nocardioides coralli]|uniref:DUF6498-containing protein n=1 Tax=Nocardioides coralli TaxID=2872154 RepID=UPI001CA40279|nr:DUF6498-containing protein [Nocardioides coralli]QZY29896.1 DUF6498-containing protein [Nocardioides coralli]